MTNYAHIIDQTKSFDYWLKKNWYYHRFLSKFYQFVIPAGSRVLQINCKTGFLLNAVKPSYGMGIDEDSSCIKSAQEHYPQHQFIVGNYRSIPQTESFDYIILSSTIMEVDDIQDLLQYIHTLCHTSTRIVIDSHSSFWEPVLRITQHLQLRRPTELKNWISRNDLINFFTLTNFQVVTQGRQILLPYYLPLITTILNSLIALIPGINALCLSEWIIARPIFSKHDDDTFSVSIIIPCKNERGNIEPAVQRCPILGSKTELIFVDGHSRDGTVEEIHRVAAKYGEKNIRYFVQSGTGKGNAVHEGFAIATGDVLMIQDADLTAPPEELPKFFDALTSGKGEFINGSRLVYGMESEAMRFLNLIANYLFAKGFSWLLGQPIKDTLCGTKVLFKKDYQNIYNNRHYFGNFDPFGDFDLIFGAAKQNLKIIDVPVHYKNRTYGTTQISRFRNGLSLLYMSWVAFIKFKIK